jgi:hypothetical protein
MIKMDSQIENALNQVRIPLKAMIIIINNTFQILFPILRKKITKSLIKIKIILAFKKFANLNKK